jgi:hypothetical protein
MAKTALAENAAAEHEQTQREGTNRENNRYLSLIEPPLHHLRPFLLCFSRHARTWYCSTLHRHFWVASFPPLLIPKQYQTAERDVFKCTSIEVSWMNAQTFWLDTWQWLSNHATETNMFIVQTLVTCSALTWFVKTLSLQCRF